MPWACPPPGHFEQSIECAEVFGSAAQAVDPQPEAQACVARAQSLLALGLADEAVRRAEQTVAVATLELSRSEAIWRHGVLAWPTGDRAIRPPGSSAPTRRGAYQARADRDHLPLERFAAIAELRRGRWY